MIASMFVCENPYRNELREHRTLLHLCKWVARSLLTKNRVNQSCYLDFQHLSFFFEAARKEINMDHFSDFTEMCTIGHLKSLTNDSRNENSSKSIRKFRVLRLFLLYWGTFLHSLPKYAKLAVLQKHVLKWGSLVYCAAVSSAKVDIFENKNKNKDNNN